MTGPKILLLDIESSPHLVWSFRMFKTVVYPDSVKEPARAICWSAKWDGDKNVRFMSEYHHDHHSMLLGIRNLLDECDVAVAYNGDRFDIPKLKQQFRLNRIEQPSPFISVDLFKVIKKAEDWPSLRLDWIATNLGLHHKMPHEGLMLWRKCMGDFGEEEQAKAWNKMRRYSKRDSVVLQDVLDEYRPQVTNIPHVALFGENKPADDRPLCPDGHANVTRQGYKRTKTRRYPQFKCEECGRWFSESRSDMGVGTK